MGVTTNAADFVSTWQGRAGRVRQSLHNGLMALLVEVNRKAIENLSGTGESGSYPVPVRTGNLRRSENWYMTSDLTGYVQAGDANTPYAVPIHEGEGSSAKYGARPFVDDAVDQTEPADFMVPALEEALA